MGEMSELRKKLIEHHAWVQKQRDEAQEAGSIDPYYDGHLYGLLNGLAFALRYLNDIEPEPVEPFDLRGPVV